MFHSNDGNDPMVWNDNLEMNVLVAFFVIKKIENEDVDGWKCINVIFIIRLLTYRP